MGRRGGGRPLRSMTLIVNSSMEHEAMGSDWATEPGAAHLALQQSLHPGSCVVCRAR
jgi:hypothetical protein